MRCAGRTVLLAAAGALALAGCESARDAMGFGKRQIDEFAVVPRAPLSLPPDFSLRPPRPGAKRPQEVSPVDRARQALVGSAETGAEGEAASSAERAFLQSAGATGTDPDIRAKIDRESGVLSQVDGGFVERLMFWRTERGAGAVVDPAKEAERLRENAAAGKPVTEGETPLIRRDRGGWR